MAPLLPHTLPLYTQINAANPPPKDLIVSEGDVDPLPSFLCSAVPPLSLSTATCSADSEPVGTGKCCPLGSKQPLVPSHSCWRKQRKPDNVALSEGDGRLLSEPGLINS